MVFRGVVEGFATALGTRAGLPIALGSPDVLFVFPGRDFEAKDSS